MLAWPVGLVGGGISGGRPGQRRARRWPGESARSTGDVRSSAAATATVWARRRHARHRSAARTAACARARSRRSARLAHTCLGWGRGVDLIGERFGGGVGEDIRQGVQPHAGGIGGGEATPGQQRSDLVHRAGDGGAVHPVQHRQGLVGSRKRRTTRVTRTRSQKPRRWWGPAPAARRRGWPRRCSRAAWWAAVQGSASSTVSSARCCRDSPVKQGWMRAARAHAGIDTHA